MSSLTELNTGLKIGSLTLDTPVVLAPMAGVTNGAFRAICREYGAGLYVSEMMMARALINRDGLKAWQRAAFAPDESPRSMQLYGTDAAVVGEAVRMLCANNMVDHIDMNFGCPAPKVTRKGGGSAVPARPGLLRAIVRAAVEAATPYKIPVTIKFRIGIDDSLITMLTTGRIAEDEGVAAIALHARTAQQRYSGHAKWEAIAELKQHVTTIPVLGNGDIWDAQDALDMMRKTGCDGVVVGRGCLGRPWLFRDLVDAFNGRAIQPAPTAAEIIPIMVDHARRLVEWHGPHGIRDFRKHPGWYFTGYPLGGELRKKLSSVSSVSELEDLVTLIDPAACLPAGQATIPRGHTTPPRPVHLPDGWLDHPEDATPPSPEADEIVSGG
jgi:nifR3 family TIM-barrel protein